MVRVVHMVPVLDKVLVEKMSSCGHHPNKMYQIPYKTIWLNLHFECGKKYWPPYECENNSVPPSGKTENILVPPFTVKDPPPSTSLVPVVYSTTSSDMYHWDILKDKIFGIDKSKGNLC